MQLLAEAPVPHPCCFNQSCGVVGSWLLQCNCLKGRDCSVLKISIGLLHSELAALPWARLLVPGEL